MSQSHLDHLQAALIHRGWTISERRRGDDDVIGSATWEIRRGAGGPALKIDFSGFGGLGEDIELDEAYSCQVRDHAIHLYFTRVRRNRRRWTDDLAAFVAALDDVSTGVAK
jgi:hypothetical protein